MRITTGHRDGTSNGRYRSVLPLRELELRGHKVIWPSRYSPEHLIDGRLSFDVLMLHQFHDERDIELVRELGRRGVAVVWDTDDDISGIPKISPEYKAFGGRRGLKRHFQQTVEIARASSLITTPSAHLAQRYREQGVEHVRVIENYVSRQDAAVPRRRHQGVVIGLTAAGEHEVDLERLRIARVLKRVLNAHEGVRVVTIGPVLRLDDPRHTHLGTVPIEQLIAAESEFDIGLAPLTETPFGLARSNVKLKEYATAGAMWLASPVGPYAGMGEQQGGLLVEDGDWFDVLDDLVRDHRRRLELMERARAWASGQSVDHAAGRWEAALRTALQRARAT